MFVIGRELYLLPFVMLNISPRLLCVDFRKKYLLSSPTTIQWWVFIITEDYGLKQSNMVVIGRGTLFCHVLFTYSLDAFAPLFNEYIKAIFGR